MHQNIYNQINDNEAGKSINGSKYNFTFMFVVVCASLLVVDHHLVNFERYLNDVKESKTRSDAANNEFRKDET